MSLHINGFHQMQNSLFKLFEHKCVLEVCTHQSYNAKNPLSVFLSLFYNPFSQKKQKKPSNMD